MKDRPALPRLILMERVYPSNPQTTFSLLSKKPGLEINEVSGSLEVYIGGASAFVPSGGFNPDLEVFITTGNTTYSFLELETQTQRVCHVMHHDGRVELLAEFLAQHEHNKVAYWQMQLQTAEVAIPIPEALKIGDPLPALDDSNHDVITRAKEMAKAKAHFFPTPIVNPVRVQTAIEVKDPTTASVNEAETAPAPAPAPKPVQIAAAAPASVVTTTIDESTEPATASTSIPQISSSSVNEAETAPAPAPAPKPVQIAAAAPASVVTTTIDESTEPATASTSIPQISSSSVNEAETAPAPAPASKPREDSDSKSAQSGSKQHAATSKQVQAAPKPVQIAAASPTSKPREDSGSKSTQSGSQKQRAAKPQVQATAASAPNTTATPASKPREDSDSKSTQSGSQKQRAARPQVQATAAPAPNTTATPASKPREDSDSKSTQSGSKTQRATKPQVQPTAAPAPNTTATPASKPREDSDSKSTQSGSKTQRATKPQVQPTAAPAPAPKPVQDAAPAPVSIAEITTDKSTEPASATASTPEISPGSKNGAAENKAQKKSNKTPAAKASTATSNAPLDRNSLEREIQDYMTSPSIQEKGLIKKANTLVEKYKTTLTDISPRKVHELMLKNVNNITDVMALSDIQKNLENLLYGLKPLKELINDQAFPEIYNKSKRFLSQSDQEALVIYTLEMRAVTTLEFFQRCGLQADRMAELINRLIETNNLIALRNGFDLLNFAEIVDMTDTLSTLINKGGYHIDIINQFIPDHSCAIPDDICQKLFKIANSKTVKRYCTNQERYASAMILICSNHRADLVATVIDRVRDLAYVRSVGLVTAMHAAIIDGNNDDDRIQFLNQLIDIHNYPLFFKDADGELRSIVTDVMYLTHEKVSPKLFQYLIEKSAKLVNEDGKLLDQTFYCEYHEDNGYYTAMEIAVLRNNYNFIKILAEVGQVEIKLDMINALLHSAASECREHSVRGLYELGANPNIVYQELGNALDQALYYASSAIKTPRNTFGVIKYLVEKGCTTITREVNLNGVCLNLTSHVQSFVDLESIINQIENANSPELWNPTFKPRCERIRDLAKGADAIALQDYILESHYDAANLLSTLWIEALTEACYARNQAVIDLALERLYGNANVIDTRGRTPLMCLLLENEGLINGQSVRIAKKLIEENHAQLFYTLDDRDYSVLFEAMLLPARLELKNRGILQEVCDFVIEKMNQQNLLNRSFYYTNSRTDCTLLEFVSMKGLSEYIEILVSKFSFDLSDETYHSAILYAAIYGNDEVLAMFKTKGVNLNGKFNDQYLVDSALYAVLGYKDYPEQLPRLVKNLALLVAEEDFVVLMPPLKVGEALTILDGQISEDIAKKLLLKSSNNQINNESSRQWQQEVSRSRKSDGVSESKGRN